MSWLAIAACVLAQGAAAPVQGVVLVLPLEAKSPGLAESSDLITTVLAGELRKQSALTVVTLRDLEGSLNLETKKLLAGCGSASCAAEIAGALNTDEVVLGSIGSVGASNMVLGVTRMKAGSALILGSSTRIIKSSDPGAVLEQIPSVVAELLHSAPPAAAPPTSMPRPSAPPPAASPSRSSPPRAGPVSRDHLDIDQYMQPSQGPDHAELSWPGFYATVGHPELASAYLGRVTVRVALTVGGILVLVGAAFLPPLVGLGAMGVLLGGAGWLTVSGVSLPSLGGVLGTAAAAVVLVLAAVGVGVVGTTLAMLGGLAMVYGGYGMSAQPISDEEIRSLAKEHNRTADAPTAE